MTKWNLLLIKYKCHTQMSSHPVPSQHFCLFHSSSVYINKYPSDKTTQKCNTTPCLFEFLIILNMVYMKKPIWIIFIGRVYIYIADILLAYRNQKITYNTHYDPNSSTTAFNDMNYHKSSFSNYHYQVQFQWNISRHNTSITFNKGAADFGLHILHFVP